MVDVYASISHAGLLLLENSSKLYKSEYNSNVITIVMLRLVISYDVMMTRPRVHYIHKYRFSSSDVMLAHFLSFAATPTYHTLPQSIQDGIPMFYLPLNKTKPVPSIDINSPAGK